jgi:hypothetical protein
MEMFVMTSEFQQIHQLLLIFYVLMLQMKNLLSVMQIVSGISVCTIPLLAPSSFVEIITAVMMELSAQ